MFFINPYFPPKPSKAYDMPTLYGNFHPSILKRPKLQRSAKLYRPRFLSLRVSYANEYIDSYYNNPKNLDQLFDELLHIVELINYVS